MKIENRGAAPPDIDFGLEPRALAPDLKSLPQKMHTGKKKRNRKNTATVGDRESDSLSPTASIFFDYVFFSM